MYCKEYLNLLVSVVVCKSSPQQRAPLLSLSFQPSSTLSPVNNHSISGHMTYWFQWLISDHMTHLYNFYIVVDIPPPQLLLQISVKWPDDSSVTWPFPWVINPFPVSRPRHMTSPRVPPWVYKLPRSAVECAVPWPIYFWPLLLLQPQQHASAEVNLQPDSPAHRLSLPRLLPESIAIVTLVWVPSLCSPSWLQASSPVPFRTFQYWNWARAAEIYALQILDLPLIPV